MYRLWLTVLAAAIVSVCAGMQRSSAEDMAQAWTWCVNKEKGSPDLQIGGCTAVIQSGRLTHENLVASFNNRGNAYIAKQDYDRAIADYDQAIKLDNRFYHAFHNRGVALYLKKNYDRAIADYDEALRLNPKFFEAFNDRGLAYQAKGNLDQAIADYNEALRVNSKYAIAAGNRDAALKAKSAVAAPAAKSSNADDLKLDPIVPQNDTYRLLINFGDIFERVRSDYVTEIDDWTVIDRAIQVLSTASGLQISRADEAVLCKEELAAHTTYGALQCFGRIFDHLHNVAPQKLEDGRLMEAAISGMVGSLDARSSYYSPKAWRDLHGQASGGAGAIGIELMSEKGQPTVSSVFDGSPAAKAGLSPGDMITRIDDGTVQGLSLDQLTEKLRGALNSTIKLTVVRRGSERPAEIALVRQSVPPRTVRWHAEGDQIGYVRIPDFTELTLGALTDAINGLKAQLGSGKIRGFIVDLRNNTGGLFNPAVTVADLFLDRGEIVTTHGRGAQDVQRFTAHPGDLTEGKSLIVLVNGGTAAASEIVAGALQDHRRATIVGTKSAAGGSVQTIVPLGEGNGAIRLTTSFFTTPSGRNLEKDGIVPDATVEQAPPDSSAKGDGLESYVPPNEADDKALQFAIKEILGVKRASAIPAGSR